MKIGIITQPLIDNYGGILQNWALQWVLKELGHTPTTLRTRKVPLAFYLYRCLAVIKNRMLMRNARFPEAPWKRASRCQGMESFIQRNIDCGAYHRFFENSDIERLKLDALVVGSDQVWRPCYNDRIEDMFCGFVRDNNVLRLAYAASFGTDKWEMNDTQTTICRELIKHFKAVSVREETGIELCHKYLDCNAEWVLDPTLLVTKEAYTDLCKNIPSTTKKFIFVYMLDLSEHMMNMAKNLAKEFNCELIIKQAGPQITATDTIEAWLASFRDARYIITDSFHGTVFSLIFNKDFAIFSNNQRGNARLESLMQIVGLNNRVVSESDTELPNSSINWQEVKTNITPMYEKSFNFLKSALAAK